jgi:hypothetical protein
MSATSTAGRDNGRRQPGIFRRKSSGLVTWPIVVMATRAYYIYGVGHHTEEDCRAEDAFIQVYRPLYEEAYAYRHGGLFDLRPLQMFFEPAKWNGQEVPRFTRIRDPDVIALLEAIKARMYPNP